jgi:hypothetical protein
MLISSNLLEALPDAAGRGRALHDYNATGREIRTLMRSGWAGEKWARLLAAWLDDHADSRTH